MQSIKNFIDKYNFNFKKKFGQNFLIDENILHKIVLSAELRDEAAVIEIGVGAGSLTKKIAPKAKCVIGYEIDTTLKPIIEENLKQYSNIEIIYDDFLKRDIKADLSGYEYSNLYVIANLPYYITTPIISKIIDDELDVDKIIIMVQKEVGERLCAKPCNREYNSLTIFINYYFKVSKLFDVSKNVFMPRPNVDSSIMLFEKRKDRYFLKNRDVFFNLVRKSFQYKRKTLKNNLKGYNLDAIDEVLKKYNLDLTVRAEHLSIDRFVEIANNISE